MTILANLLRKIGFRKQGDALSMGSAEELRAAFKARYHNFTLLLSANNKALEIMSEMEEALKGNRTFGMSFIRAQCTGVTVNVFRIIQNLDRIAPGKYKELFDRFHDIQNSINELLASKKLPRGDRFVIPFSGIDRDMADQVGSKMSNLGDIRKNLGLRVPDGFVISASAYERFFGYNDLQSEIDRLLQASSVDELDQLFSLSAEIQQLIIRAAVPDDLADAIREAYRELEIQAGAGVKVSMRSSALGEDSAGTSFAGQYRSELNVSPENLIQAYKEIVASKYSLQAIAYRATRGIRDEDIAMCVGCMAMINGTAGGVTYSRNPLNIRDDSILVHSVWGLPKSVVDGSAPSDLFVLSRMHPLQVVEKKIRDKEFKFVCYPDEGVCRLDLTGQQGLSSIEDSQATELAEIALKLEEYYGSPQDIEWAIGQDGAVYVLQCRPLKQSESAPGQYVQAPGAAEGEVLYAGGVTAGPGVAWGPVFVIRKDSDALLFPKDAVLVASQALPRWAALLNRAAAVVTEQGSAAGHLANVAREFGVPALFGVAGATELFETGEEVTVDALGQRIYRGRIESLLTRSDAVRNLMAGSPVYEVLEEAVEHVVPLQLLDPDSSEFRPKNCRTLHDITRFCHEKAVKEMFSFGSDHRFSERAAKQLVCDVPMQWWIINLDDGFKEDIEGKFVHLDNIVSIPMLALWEGIIAVPWEGPPPVDSKGFMSILLEATANPALDPSMPSPYANRNYFMLSRNFCSLSSRFGFHFSTIEALVGERPGENYISFRFKGGAADSQRRIRRAHFIAGILEEFSFRAEVRDDSVSARIEGYDQAVMKEKLKVLGYLIIHTRQLDMVMFNDASYNHHRDKLLQDIHSIITPLVARNAVPGRDMENSPS